MAITKLIADSITSGAIANTPNFFSDGVSSSQAISHDTFTALSKLEYTN
jgi:hypothetical protein